ncbi:unnamed protein product [Schistosoma margrebowiei]|uniref:Uncharacterized protein n=1 Tax=Schistosoma margrebowiei TaxID=48269 RepID=A0A183M2D5_9TREM|nr:unnamed protein product [Schistosoma margrebowiei]
MARSRAPSSCFGAKKQRLDEESTSRTCVPRNGLNTPGVVRREMCYFCFDVLHNHLRNIEPPPAPKTFPNSSYAIKDSRFSPITEEEFPHLTCSVSLLLNFEEGKNYQDWQIGVHGIRIEFVNEKGYHRTATYLPEVAYKQGWNHCETIDSLLRKGGYRGNISEAFRQSIRLTRYRSEKYSVHASEYLRARQNGYRV